MTGVDALGERMKAHEQATRYQLPSRAWTILRVDGRAFHTLLRGSDKPFDYDFIFQMTETAKELCRQVTTTRFAYTQSDEISLLLAPFGSEHTEPWFGGVVQKMASISASIATMAFNREGRFSGAMFDSRVYTLPDVAEVENYFLWRQADATRNSLSMLARAYFSHKELYGKNSSQMQEMLWSEHKINWNDLNSGCKRGRVIVRKSFVSSITYQNKRTKEVKVAENVLRHHWVTESAPIFAADGREWLTAAIEKPLSEA